MSQINVGKVVLSNSLKLPQYSNSNRPTGEVGMAIWNDEEGRMEVYDGTDWIGAGEKTSTSAVLSVVGGNSYDFSSQSVNWDVTPTTDATLSYDISVDNPGWVRLEMWGASRDTSYRGIAAQRWANNSTANSGINNSTSRGYGGYAASNLYLPSGNYWITLNNLTYAGSKNGNYGVGGGLCGFFVGNGVSRNNCIMVAGSAAGGTFDQNSGGNGGGIYGGSGSNNGLTAGTNGGFEMGGSQTSAGTSDKGSGFTCQALDASEFNGGNWGGTEGSGGGAGWYGGSGGRGHCGYGGSGGGGGSGYIGKTTSGANLIPTGTGSTFGSWRSGYYSDFSNHESNSERENSIGGVIILYGGAQKLYEGGFNNTLTNTPYTYGRFKFSYPVGSV